MAHETAQTAEVSRDFRSLSTRMTLYMLLAQGFAYPAGRDAADQAMFLQNLAESVQALGLELQGGEETRFFAALKDKFLQENGFLGLEEEYTYLFSRETRVPPYETSYLQEQTFARVSELADITGFYRAFGLEPSAGVGEPPDYVGAELEFMAVLCAKEAYALEHGWAELAQVCRDARRAFLRDHLGRWFPLFVERLRDAARLAWYPRLASVGEALLALDRAELEIEIKVLEEVRAEAGVSEDVIGPCGEQA